LKDLYVENDVSNEKMDARKRWARKKPWRTTKMYKTENLRLMRSMLHQRIKRWGSCKKKWSSMHWQRPRRFSSRNVKLASRYSRRKTWSHRSTWPPWPLREVILWLVREEPKDDPRLIMSELISLYILLCCVIVN
jgi:hypothetical protein